ncbi:MAG TPA: hypothetical protein VF669_23005 [Tepidisphaeraceae bacterium]|jgi:hypothetical protein
MKTSQNLENFPKTPTASPRPSDDCDGPWWLPNWWEAAKLLGWRWVLAFPAVAALMLGGLGLLDYRFWNFLIVIGFKMMVIAIAVPLGALTNMMRTIVQRRKDPFCIHCGYSLDGLPDHHKCPECGRAYHLELIDEYRRDPHWYIQRAQAVHCHPPAHAPFAAGAVASPPSRDGT